MFAHKKFFSAVNVLKTIMPHFLKSMVNILYCSINKTPQKDNLLGCAVEQILPLFFNIFPLAVIQIFSTCGHSHHVGSQIVRDWLCCANSTGNRLSFFIKLFLKIFFAARRAGATCSSLAGRGVCSDSFGLVWLRHKKRAESPTHQ